MPSNSIKNEKQYEALKDKGMSKERAARIANSPDASKHGGQQSGKGGDSRQGGTTAQKKDAGRKGGRAAARKSELIPAPTTACRGTRSATEERGNERARQGSNLRPTD